MLLRVIEGDALLQYELGQTVNSPRLNKINPSPKCGHRGEQGLVCFEPDARLAPLTLSPLCSSARR